MSEQNNTAHLADLSDYIYGTTRLGEESIPLEDRINIALEAMKTGVWFHASDQYGSALGVLAQALKRDPVNTPKMIFKIEAESIGEFRRVIKSNIEPLGVSYMDVGQLCLRNRDASDFVEGSREFDEISQIKQEGLVKRYVMEVFPWTSHIALEALKRGCTKDLIEGFIFYLNPLQRFALNELWDLIQEKNIPVIAMRTVCGNNVLSLRDIPGAAWKDYIQQRATEIAPIFEQSGIQSWSEFCVRFAHSLPLVNATVGSTSKSKNLNEFLRVTENVQVLPTDIVDAITSLQRKWSNSYDCNADAWSM